MKITIESTNSAAEYSKTVTVAIPGDDLTVGQAVRLAADALVAYGYARDQVEEWDPSDD